jgi:hypothetical protein
MWGFTPKTEPVTEVFIENFKQKYSDLMRKSVERKAQKY